MILNFLFVWQKWILAIYYLEQDSIFLTKISTDYFFFMVAKSPKNYTAMLPVKWQTWGNFLDFASASINDLEYLIYTRNIQKSLKIFATFKKLLPTYYLEQFVFENLNYTFKTLQFS